MWNGEITYRHDCNCEFDCGQIHVNIVSPEERELLEAGAVSYEELRQDWQKVDKNTNCHPQAFILQALVDAKISHENWPKYTPALEGINLAIGGFTMDHRDQIHPDIYMEGLKKDPLIKVVSRFLKAVA